MLTSLQPTIEELGDHLFKYRLDADALDIGPDIAAVCVSRPTNPTGNVLTDDEMARLMDVAERAGVPLIVDNAYGMPFPRILFTEVQPVWNDNVIMCMSMSKLGLPGIRTGVIVASEDIIDAIGSVNSVLSLAVPTVGAVLLNELVVSGRILEISEHLIRPYYERKLGVALAALHESFAGLDYRVHKPEGALFLWLWFPELPISSAELYRRLRERDVLVLSGHHFFPGLATDWAHRDECIRVTYSQDDEAVKRGLAIIADEVRRARG
jgi:valine--pyruvate aminotransferase